MEFVATSTQGLEDVVAEEIKEITGKRVRAGRGRVEFEGSLREMYRVNLRSRCANKVLLLLSRGTAETLEEIYRISKEVDYTEIISGHQTFAVRATRIGEHPFTSPEIAAEVGRAIIDSFRESTGRRLKVNLDDPDVEIHVLLRDDEFILSVNTTGESLHRRGYRRYEHPAPIKPTLASSLIRLSGWRASSSFLDPMCGSGTIPIEAALMAMGTKNERTFAFEKLKIHDEELFREEKERGVNKEIPEKITGLEVSPKHLKGAMENASAAGVLEHISFIEGDAKRMEKYLDFSPEFMVVNPPYGIRSSRKGAIRDLYQGFMKSAERISEGTVLVVITAAEKELKEALEKVDAELKEERFALYGDLPVKIFKILMR